MDSVSLPMTAAAPDFIVTATGDRNVVDDPHFATMKDGCVIGNAGHFDVEINLSARRRLASESTKPQPSVEEYRLKEGRRIRLLAVGRLVNLAAAEGHPSAVMDMSFADQALSVTYIRARHTDLAKTVHKVPPGIDREVARLKLDALGIAIDSLLIGKGTICRHGRKERDARQTVEASHQIAFSSNNTSSSSVRFALYDEGEPLRRRHSMWI